jgi:hypothetical protein
MKTKKQLVLLYKHVCMCVAKAYRCHTVVVKVSFKRKFGCNDAWKIGTKSSVVQIMTGKVLRDIRHLTTMRDLMMRS